MFYPLGKNSEKPYEGVASSLPPPLLLLCDRRRPKKYSPFLQKGLESLLSSISNFEHGQYCPGDFYMVLLCRSCFPVLIACISRLSVLIGHY